MAPQTESELYAQEKELLAQARDRRLAGHRAKKQARQQKFGNYRLNLSDIEDDGISAEITADEDAGVFDWRIVLEAVNS